MTAPIPAAVPVPVVPAAPAQEPNPAAPAATPPWGTDFDAEKAWNLVQNLRADKDKLAARPVLTDEQKTQLAEYQKVVEASKTEAQRLADSAAAAQREAETAKAEAIRYKAAATHKIGAEHFDLLGTGTEDEVLARAEKVAALLTAQAAVVPPVVPPTTPTTRPVEQLQPGATPAGAVDEDELVYQTLFGAPK